MESGINILRETLVVQPTLNALSIFYFTSKRVASPVSQSTTQAFANGASKPFSSWKEWRMYCWMTWEQSVSLFVSAMIFGFHITSVRLPVFCSYTAKNYICGSLFPRKKRQSENFQSKVI